MTIFGISKGEVIYGLCLAAMWGFMMGALVI